MDVGRWSLQRSGMVPRSGADTHHRRSCLGVEASADSDKAP